MCGRYAVPAPLGELARRFGCADAQRGFAPRWNLAPGQPAPVVLRRTGRALELARWGLPLSPGRKAINARAETLAERPRFKPLLSRRCLVPAAGFYEWGPERGRGPLYFQRGDQALFAFAGLWEAGGDGDPIRFCVATVAANALVADVHQRMPAILAPQDEAAWLEAEPARALALLAPFPAEAMRARRVSPRVNDARVEGPECLEPPEQLELPEGSP